MVTIAPAVTAAQYEHDRALDLSQAEERALFRARRAVTLAAFAPPFTDTLRQLAQSDRRTIRDHAVLLAHQAAAIDWTRRHNGGDAA